MDRKAASYKVDNFKARIVDQNVMIVDTDNVCVASSDPNYCGNTIMPFSEESSVKLCLENGYKINIFFEKNKFNQKELEIIKSLTRFVLNQYLSNITQPVSSLDHLITSYVTSPINQEKIRKFQKDAEIYGLDLSIKRAAILMEIDNFSQDYLLKIHGNYTQEDVLDDWKNKITKIIGDFFSTPTEIFTIYIGQNRFVCFKEITDEDKFIRYMKNAYLSIFSSMLNSQADNLLVSFSDTHFEAIGIHEAFQEAFQAALIGRKFIHNKKQSLYYGDLGTLRIIAEENIDKKKNFAHEILEPLTKETLKVTLETFLNENMNINEAAKKLKVHPNTINYRLGKIAEILGLDPKVFKQAFELRIALLTDKILNE